MVCTRLDKTYPFFFHSDMWVNNIAWQQRLNEVQAMPGYNETETVSEDGLTLTRVATFESQEQAESIINYNLAHFPEMYDRISYAEGTHHYVQSPPFWRKMGKYMPSPV